MPFGHLVCHHRLITRFISLQPLRAIHSIPMRAAPNDKSNLLMCWVAIGLSCIFHLTELFGGLESPLRRARQSDQGAKLPKQWSQILCLPLQGLVGPPPWFDFQSVPALFTCQSLFVLDEEIQAVGQICCRSGRLLRLWKPIVQSRTRHRSISPYVQDNLG